MKATNCFLLVALLKLAVGMPDPDNIDIQILQEVKTGGGCSNGNNCCKKGCVFDGVVYEDGCYLKDTCFEMECCDGTWKYKGFNKDCGECKVEGDPHVTTWDELDVDATKSIPKYIINTTGEYIIAQSGFDALFRVNATFKMYDLKEANYGYNAAGIDNATYNEPGISVDLILPPTWIAPTWKGDIEVLVNTNRIQVDTTVQPVYGGLAGPILVFKHPHTDKNGVDCISVVGTKGLSVSLCKHSILPSFYIWAIESLKAPRNSPLKGLQGLCNTWTGTDAQYLVLGNKTEIPSQGCLTYKKLDNVSDWEICNEFSKSWKLPYIIHD